MSNFPLTVTTKVKVTEQQIVDLLCCGLEGGVNYWAMYQVGYSPTPEELQKHSKEGYDDMPVYAISHPEYILKIRDIQADKVYRLSLGGLKLGITEMATKFPKHFLDVMQDNCDAETGDVFIQCCVFGDLIYG